MSKRKGSRYEREFAERVQDRGLSARRVPLSGSMEGYPGDVVVADEVLVECKYRADGAGFKRLYDWMAESPRDVLGVQADGVGLLVHTLDAWCERITRRVDGECEDQLAWSRTSGSGWVQLCGWIQDCEFLAVRMPRCEWLVVEVL